MARERSPSDIAPPETVPTEDVGAETLERFAYQHRYTAIAACALLVSESDVVEVYCEHLEDVLVKLATGYFHGIQVKTKEPGLEQWKASSPEMLRSLARFAQLESTLGNHFAVYTLATDHQFFRAKKNGRNLPHMLDVARAHDDSKPLPKPLARLVNAVAKRAKCSGATVVAALRKTRCDDGRPKKADARRQVMDAICASLPEAADVPYWRIGKLADVLTAAVFEASSLKHKQSLPLYLGFADAKTCADKILAAMVEGKRLTKAKVRALLLGMLSTPEMLEIDEAAAPPHALSPGDSPLTQKLSAGDFSSVSIANARDMFSAALNQHLRWVGKYGQKEALKRYHHISGIVQNEAAQAYEETVHVQSTSGLPMLKELRARLEERRDKEGGGLFGCTDEHLLGYAYMLTDACKVWWSKPFTLRQPE